MNNSQYYKLFSAVAQTTTSSVYDISLARSIAFTFTSDTYSSGSGTYTIDVSNDGTNWVTSVAFLDATQTTATTYVTSKVLSSATTAGAVFLNKGFKLIRCVMTYSATGTYSGTICINE